MKKKKYFGKYPTTEEEQALAYRIENLFQEAKRLGEVEDNLFKEYWAMEGKYSTGKVYTDACQGFRGYDYNYASREDKLREMWERDAVRAKAWEVKTGKEKLQQQAWDLEKEMCVLMHGCTEEEYRLRERIKDAEEDVISAQERLERLKKELKEMQEKG